MRYFTFDDDNVTGFYAASIPGGVEITEEKYEIALQDQATSAYGIATDGKTIFARVPTQEVLDQQAEDSINSLYKSALAYQGSQIDINLSNEITKAESLVEAEKAIESDLPLAKANGDWVELLWSLYYKKKVSLSAGDYYNEDFSSIGNVPNDFASVRGERKSFLGKK